MTYREFRVCVSSFYFSGNVSLTQACRRTNLVKSLKVFLKFLLGILFSIQNLLPRPSRLEVCGGNVMFGERLWKNKLFILFVIA